MSLNDKIISYLAANGVPHVIGDFRVQQDGVSEVETITYWSAALGPQPTQAQLDAAPAYVPVPQVVKNWQGQAVMLTSKLPNGMTYDAAARAAIAALPAPTNLITLAAYESADFTRDSPTLNALLTGIGLTPTQIDALFVQASALSL
jgi:hypothetical protein